MNLRHLTVLLALVAISSSACTLRAADGTARPTATQTRRDYDAGVLFVDVRSDEEWRDGHLRSALHLQVDAVGKTAATVLPDKDKPIVTYCQSGGRAQTAAAALRALGYTRVTAMAGGIDDLEAAGFPIER